MDGFKAFKYFTAMRLHFTNPTFNVFENRGRVKGSFSAFMNRNDRLLFDRLARKYDDKEFIKFCAANFMYGHGEMIYESQQAENNYKEFQKRKQAITKVFSDDCHRILNSKAKYTIVDTDIPDVLKLFLGSKITIETMVILNNMDGIVEKYRKNNQLVTMFGPELLRIEKSTGFVKYDTYKIMNVYMQFLEDVKENG